MIYYYEYFSIIHFRSVPISTSFNMSPFYISEATAAHDSILN